MSDLVVYTAVSFAALCGAFTLGFAAASMLYQRGVLERKD